MDDTKLVSAGEKSGQKFNPVEFVRETRREIAKVTWPTRKETVVTTILIITMALLFGVFFFVIDYLLGFGVSHILGIKG